MKSLTLKKSTSFSRSQLAVFVAIFALIGGYILYHSFATAPLVASLEAEQMVLPSGGSVITDSLASGGKAIKLTTNGASTGSVNFPSSVTSLTIIAKGAQCQGAPTMNVSLDGNNQLSNQAVSSTSWNSYSVTPITGLNSGSHSLTISFTNDYTQYRTKHGHTTPVCSRDLYVDVTNFFGPTPPPPLAPTVTLSASPSSAAAGSASTLTWGSTNATSCTASGAWGGSQPTIGSASTGALNQTSTYTLTCTGTGGSVSASVVISVTAAPPPPPPSGVIPPTPPSAYNLPANAVTVSTSAALQAALSGSTKDIIIANGDYTNATYMSMGSHRLWAQALGGATLHFGLSLGENSGTGDPEIHGLKFNVNSAGLGFQSDILNIWGQGQNAVVADSWFYGNNAMDVAIAAHVTSGLQVHRVVVNGFQSYGIFFETYYPGYWTDAPAAEPVVSDADISAISRTIPGSSNGTAEAGLWAGTNCLCSNIKIRNTGWMGIWTGGNADSGVYSNFDIDQAATNSSGVYLEHYSRNNIFKNFIIGGDTKGSGIQVGFTCEWADPQYAGTNTVVGQSISACHGNTFQDGTIYSSNLGFNLEDAQDTTIKTIKFIGQSRAAIKDFMSAGSGQTTTWQNLGNDFTGLPSGAVQYTQAH